MRPYTAIIQRGPKTFSASTVAADYNEAWLDIVTEYSDPETLTKIHVGQYYTLLSNGERSVVAGEADTEDLIASGWEPRSLPTFALTWLAAKAAFGFDLTPVQKALLAKQQALIGV